MQQRVHYVLGGFLALSMLLRGCGASDTPSAQTGTSPPHASASATTRPDAGTASLAPGVHETARSTSSPVASPRVPTRIAATQSPTATASPTPISINDLFSRRDVPPAGVESQYILFQGGAGVGPDTGQPTPTPDLTPRITVDYDGQEEIGTEFVIRFEHFRPGRTLDLAIRLPDRSVQEHRVDIADNGSGFLRWLSQPGDQLGTHVITASQGDLRTMTTFVVKLPAAPRMLTLDEGVQVPGGTFRFGLAGYPPEQSIALYLYRIEWCTGNYYCCQYATELPPVRVDARGETIFTLHTQPDDPIGAYMLLTLPRAYDRHLETYLPEDYKAACGGAFFELK